MQRIDRWLSKRHMTISENVWLTVQLYIFWRNELKVMKLSKKGKNTNETVWRIIESTFYKLPMTLAVKIQNWIKFHRVKIEKHFSLCLIFNVGTVAAAADYLICFNWLASFWNNIVTRAHHFQLRHFFHPTRLIGGRRRRAAARILHTLCALNYFSPIFAESFDFLLVTKCAIDLNEASSDRAKHCSSSIHMHIYTVSLTTKTDQKQHIF